MNSPPQRKKIKTNEHGSHVFWIDCNASRYSSERHEKQNFRCFLSTDIPTKSSSNACTKVHVLISPQSRASYSQPKCKSPREPFTKRPAAILRINLLLLVHRVYCRTKISAATAVDFFFTYKTLRKSVAEKGYSNCSQKYNNVRNVIRHERGSGEEVKSNKTDTRQACWGLSRTYRPFTCNFSQVAKILA
jgi:hypothetical protein